MTALPRHTQSPGRYPIPAERAYIKSRKAPLPPPAPVPLPRREVICVDNGAIETPPKMHINHTTTTLSQGYGDAARTSHRTGSQYFSDRDSEWCSSGSSTVSSVGQSSLLIVDSEPRLDSRSHSEPIKDKPNTRTLPAKGDQRGFR